MTTKIIIGVALVFAYFCWKGRKIKNSHKIPQRVEIPNDIPNLPPNLQEPHKGYTMTLSRELKNNESGYHLFVTVATNGSDLSNLKHIIFSWTEWESRAFDFHYDIYDPIVTTDGGKVRIDLGSFNNCAGSRNFLKRTAASKVVKCDLLDYVPKHGDFSYETNYETQSIFWASTKTISLKEFIKGLHYIDS